MYIYILSPPSPSIQAGLLLKLYGAPYEDMLTVSLWGVCVKRKGNTIKVMFTSPSPAAHATGLECATDRGPVLGGNHGQSPFHVSLRWSLGTSCSLPLTSPTPVNK